MGCNPGRCTHVLQLTEPCKQTVVAQALLPLLEGGHSLAALHTLASIATGLRSGPGQPPPAAVATLISSAAPEAIFARLAALAEVRPHGQQQEHARGCASACNSIWSLHMVLLGACSPGTWTSCVGCLQMQLTVRPPGLTGIKPHVTCRACRATAGCCQLLRSALQRCCRCCRTGPAPGQQAGRPSQSLCWRPKPCSACAGSWCAPVLHSGSVCGSSWLLAFACSGSAAQRAAHAAAPLGALGCSGHNASPGACTGGAQAGSCARA